MNLCCDQIARKQCLKKKKKNREIHCDIINILKKEKKNTPQKLSKTLNRICRAPYLNDLF